MTRIVPIPKIGVSDEVSRARHQSSTYDEVYSALGKFKVLLRLLGLFPIVAEVAPEGGGTRGTEVLHLRRHPASLIPSVLSLLGCCLYFYFLIWHYIILVPNFMESITRALAVAFFAFFALLNLFSLVANADQWPSYFGRFHAIDRLLDLRHDPALRSHVRLCTTVAAVLFTFQIGSSILTLIISQLYGDFATLGFPIGTLLYAIFIQGCHILPEILFTCLCKALMVRFQRLAELARGLVSGEDGDPEVAEGLERCREIHRLLMEAIAGTNAIMGGTLTTTCCMNPMSLSVAAYFLVRESLSNSGITMLKVSLLFASSSRILAVCFFASEVEYQILNLKRILYQAQTIRLSDESSTELVLFMRCIKISRSEFTAGGFVTVNKGFLAKVAGTILTYTLTLLQFDQQENVELKLEQDGCPSY